jgi:hypothetical protein
MVVSKVLFANTTLLWATCCLMCFKPIVNSFLTLILTTVRTVLSNLEIEAMAGVTGQQGMLTPS